MMIELKSGGNNNIPKKIVSGIYGLYNEDISEWIYIGKSGDIYSRIRKHIKNIYNPSNREQHSTYRKIRAFTANSYCNWYIIKECKNDKSIYKIERKIIEAYKPIANTL